MQVRMADQAMCHQGNQSVFVGGRLWTLLPPPALLKRERKEEREGEKFYIYSDVTHTHNVYIFHPGPIENGCGWFGLTFRPAVSRSCEKRNAIPIYAHDFAGAQ